MLEPIRPKTAAHRKRALLLFAFVGPLLLALLSFQNFSQPKESATAAVTTASASTLIPLNLNFEAGYSWGPTFIDRQETKYAGTQYVVTPQLRAPYETGFKDYPFTIDYATNYKATFDVDGNQNRFLKMNITSNLPVEENYKDKVELNVTQTSDPMYGFDFTSQGSSPNRRYLAFDFKLDAKYQVPYQWALHMQAFQSCGFGPPFAIYVESRPPDGNPLGPVNLIFVAKDDASNSGTFPSGTKIYRDGYEIYRLNNVKRDQWHKMVIQFQPMHNNDMSNGPTNKGQIAMWYEGSTDKAFVWYHDWGYAPNATSDCSGKPLEAKLNFKLGIYRRRHNSTQIIGFDNIRFGTTMESVTAP
jgi:Polysaccharide lyase